MKDFLDFHVMMKHNSKYIFPLLHLKTIAYWCPYQTLFEEFLFCGILLKGDYYEHDYN